MRTTSSANKRQFIYFDEIFAPILLYSSMFAKSVIKIENEEVNFIIDLFINNHAIVSSVFGIGQIIVYLVHYHMVVFCYENAVVG
jgi:hypothetical protein